MNEQELLPEAEQPDPNCCSNCNISIMPSANKVPLCQDCRQQFIKFPIPGWVKWFGVVVLLLVGYSFYYTPKNFASGVLLKKARQAMEEKNYLTAQQYLAKLVEKQPGYIEGKAYLLIAAWHNTDYNNFFVLGSELTGKTVDDDDLFKEVQSLLEESSQLFSSDSFDLLIKEYGSHDSIPFAVYQDYLARNPHDQYACFTYASEAIDQDQNQLADSLLNGLLKLNPAHLNAMMLKLPVKRDLNQFDSAYYYADRLLEFNKQNTYALSGKIRTKLKERKDDEALQMAEANYALYPDDGYVAATLALAYHFKNQKAKSEAILNQLGSDSSKLHYMTYVQDVITGKEPFRN